MVCRAPLGLVSILSGRSQGGARSSLALGWLVTGRWPEAAEPQPRRPPRSPTTTLAWVGNALPRGPKARPQASPGQSESASDALGQRPAKSSSPNGAGQKVSHALHPAQLSRPVGALPILYFQTQGGLPWAGLSQAVGLKRRAIHESNDAMETMDSMLGLEEAGQGSRGRTSQLRAKRACERRPGSTARNIIQPQSGRDS